MTSVPRHDWQDQYEALRVGRSMVSLAGWSSVTISGADRQAFLHNFCTNDVKRLQPGTSCEAFITNVKGKILGHGLVVCHEAALELIGPPGQAAGWIEHLDRYLIREDVLLRDSSEERAYWLLAGGEAARASVRELASAVADRAAGPQPLPHASATLAGRSVGCIAWDLLRPQFACVLAGRAEDRDSIAAALAKLGFVAASEEAFTAARVEAGVPLFGVDFDESNLPQEVGREAEAISFTKGCYLGQETVARIDALGHVNQRLVGVRFFGGEPPSPGLELTAEGGARAGQVRSAAFSPRLAAPLALAMVRREHSSAGRRLASAAGECEVVPLPLGVEPHRTG